MRAGAIAVLALVGVLAAPDGARAEWKPEGALGARVLLRSGTMLDRFRCDVPPCEARDAGGSLLVDLWQPFGVFRLGVATGLAFIGGEDDETRVFTPLGLSLAVRLLPEPMGFSFRMRSGLWAGATNPGFRAGPWTSFGAHFEWALDRRLALTAGLEVDILFMHGTTTLFAPGVGLAWRPS